MTEWQAAILLAQLARVEDQIAIREERASELDSLLANISGITLFDRDERVTRHSHHLYMFRFRSEAFGGATKSQFLAALNAEGIPVGAGYVELQKQPLFDDPLVRRILSRPIDFASLDLPETARACRETVWLPQNVLLGTRHDIEQVAEAIEKVRNHGDELTAL
jgi:dTDP-4-amino-4,6-dideoxygalactose transaminase